MHRRENGAGKSTLIKGLLNLKTADESYNQRTGT